MKIVLNPIKNKNIDFIDYGDVKEGQCFVAKDDLSKENPPVWMKTTKIINGHQYCALLNTKQSHWENGRLGYYNDNVKVFLVNMLCIATYDHEENKEKEENELEEVEEVDEWTF